MRNNSAKVAKRNAFGIATTPNRVLAVLILLLAVQILAIATLPSVAQEKSFQIEAATIAQMHAAMKAGKLTCRQLTQAYLDRIAANDKRGAKINSLIAIDPQALATADEMDRTFAKSSARRSLHCIPVILKDNVNTANLATTGGSLSLKGYVPQNDAFITRKLKEAGAIVLAKANLHEFAVWGESVSSLGGQTLNPYDLTRTPGGSSGGTGAAIAANFGAVGIGTDTVNSIRSPASACSLVGIRPTKGLVSRSGIIPYSLTQDMAGPIARSVTDAVLTLDAIAGYDPTDSATAWSVGNRQKNYSQFLKPNSLRGARIGVLRNFFGSGTEHAQVNAVMKQAIADLRQQGATIVDIEMTGLDSTKLASEVSVHLYELKADLDRYLQNLTPKPPVQSLAEIVASKQYHPSLDKTLKQALTLSIEDPEYKQRRLKQQQLQTDILQVMADNQLDALIYPHQQRLVVPVGETQVERNGVLASVTGFPAITVPAGFSTPTNSAPIGVPVGIEFFGRPWSEPTLIRLAYSYEQAVQRRRPPQSLGE